jgi:hypothetical protein
MTQAVNSNTEVKEFDFEGIHFTGTESQFEAWKQDEWKTRKEISQATGINTDELNWRDSDWWLDFKDMDPERRLVSLFKVHRKVQQVCGDAEQVVKGLEDLEFFE